MMRRNALACSVEKAHGLTSLPGEFTDEPDGIVDPGAFFVIDGGDISACNGESSLSKPDILL